MADDTAISFKIAGTRYDISLGSFTPADVGDFRKATGQRLMDIVNADVSDIDLIAGVVWLVRRRGNRQLSYKAVAESFTYDDLEIVTAPAADGEDVHEPEPNSPEA